MPALHIPETAIREIAAALSAGGTNLTSECAKHGLKPTSVRERLISLGLPTTCRNGERLIRNPLWRRHQNRIKATRATARKRRPPMPSGGDK